MGLFDLPRINFHGNVDIHVPTINNAYTFPLTLYDATRSRPFFPPRLYFTTKAKIDAVSVPFDPDPQADPYLIDSSTNLPLWFIEIKSIDTIEKLRQWCITPVGQDNNSPDAGYFPFYEASKNDLAGGPRPPFQGDVTGYWNMWGDMSVRMSQVHVSGVTTFDPESNKPPVTWQPSDITNAPPDVKPFLGASFDLDTAPGSGISTASMVETISNQSVYANIFCSQANLFETQNPDNVFLSGKPFRFSALLYANWRTVNWFPPMAGSARWVSSIPLEEIPDQEQSQLLAFFNANKDDPRPIKGVFVSFTTFEIFENRINQSWYLEEQAKGVKFPQNPATARTVGNITPWYEGDMKTGVLGRNLISLGQESFTRTGPNSQVSSVPLAPAISRLKRLDADTALFSIDMGNTWPEAIDKNLPWPEDNTWPIYRGEANFHTWELGMLNFHPKDQPSNIFASIEVNESANPRLNVFAKGCVFDFLIQGDQLINQIQQNLIQVSLNTGSENKSVLLESEYMMISDTKGLYTNENDDASLGYRVYDKERIPCRLRIMQKGFPVTEPINVIVAKFRAPEAANDPMTPYGENASTVTLQLKDNDIVNLVNGPVQLTDNASYYFVYEGQYPNNQIPPYTNASGGYTIMDTGGFVCLRVHEFKDYSQYENGSLPVTFDIVYEEIFKLYDVVYPVMASIHPFTKEVWQNGTMAGLVLQRTSLDIWNDVLYMPKSRELSDSQRRLLEAWVKYINNNPNSNQT